MFDFLAAIGLFFAIEGILFAAFPLGTKRAMVAALDMPECVRKGGRTLGIFATAATDVQIDDDVLDHSGISLPSAASIRLAHAQQRLGVSEIK